MDSQLVPSKASPAGHSQVLVLSAPKVYNSLPLLQDKQASASPPLHVSHDESQGIPGSGNTSGFNGSSGVSLSQCPQKNPSSGKHSPTI